MSNNKQRKQALDEAIAEVLNEMKGFTADSEQYAKMVDQLDKLYKMRASLPSWYITPEAALPIISNLFGLGAIMNFERTHAMTTKALGFVTRPRV